MTALAARALSMRLSGLTYQQIGEAEGFSGQRAYQLTKPPKDVREAVVAAARGRCDICHNPLSSSGHVHHRSTRTTPEKYNAAANLQFLCPLCHRREHGTNLPLLAFGEETAERKVTRLSYELSKAAKNRPYIERIRFLRVSNRVTQSQLSTQLRKQDWKIDGAQVSRYENGHRTPADPWAYEVAVHAAVEALVGK